MCNKINSGSDAALMRAMSLPDRDLDLASRSRLKRINVYIDRNTILEIDIEE